MRVRVEIQDEEGMRTSMEREGESVNETFRYKTIKDIVKFLEDQIPSPSAAESYDIKNEDLTIKERLAFFLRYDERAPTDWFTTSELRRIYEGAYDDNVKLSTMSTYLADMYSDGILTRKGSRAGRRYKVVSVTTDTANQRREDVPNTDREIIAHNEEGNDDMEFIDCFPLREIIQN